jgi:mercuric ion transport protein
MFCRIARSRHVSCLEVLEKDPDEPSPGVESMQSTTAVTGRRAPPSGRDQQLSLAANAGAILSAFIASACCVGPLVLALLGLGGGALLVKFEPYRPYFTAATLLLLGAGFWLQYRTPKAAAVEGDACACPAPRANRAGRIMLWVASVLVVGFLVFPYIAPVVWD